MALRSFEQLREIYLDEMTNLRPSLTDDSEGSVADTLSRTTALAVSEIARIALGEFAKTFFDSAAGPEITGGPDDLQTLAVDHFGEDFARPGASLATGVVTFSRPTTNAGNVTIPLGTSLSTKKDPSGKSLLFVTDAEVIMTGLALEVQVSAVLAGSDSNVIAGRIVQIDSPLTDPTIVVTNLLPTAGGSNPQDDETYRSTIRNRLKSLSGSIPSSIEAAALTAPGVAYASAIELNVPVVEYDIATGERKSGATFFRIPLAKVYVADADGNSSAAMVAAALEKVREVRAFGVHIQVEGALAASLDWSLDIVLNPLGPNYVTLLVDTALIRDAMEEYMLSIPIGAGFDVSDATAAVFAQFGPSGTGDLTSAVTVTPAADINGVPGVKAVPGTMTAT